MTQKSVSTDDVTGLTRNARNITDLPQIRRNVHFHLTIYQQSPCRMEPGKRWTWYIILNVGITGTKQTISHRPDITATIELTPGSANKQRHPQRLPHFWYYKCQHFVVRGYRSTQNDFFPIILWHLLQNKHNVTTPIERRANLPTHQPTLPAIRQKLRKRKVYTCYRAKQAQIIVNSPML